MVASVDEDNAQGKARPYKTCMRTVRGAEKTGHHNIPEDIELSWHEQPASTKEGPDEMQGPRYRILRHLVQQRYVCILFRVNEKLDVALISCNYLERYIDLHHPSQEFLGTSYRRLRSAGC
jgi:hypothetical protein